LKEPEIGSVDILNFSEKEESTCIEIAIML